MMSQGNQKEAVVNLNLLQEDMLKDPIVIQFKQFEHEHPEECLIVLDELFQSISNRLNDHNWQKMYSFQYTSEKNCKEITQLQDIINYITTIQKREDKVFFCIRKKDLNITIDISECECKLDVDEIKFALSHSNPDNIEKQSLQWVEQFLCKIKESLCDENWQQINDLYFYHADNGNWEKIIGLEELIAALALKSSTKVAFAVKPKNHKITINAVETTCNEKELTVTLLHCQTTNQAEWYDALKKLLNQINVKLKDKNWQNKYTIHKCDKAFNGCQMVLHSAVDEIEQLIELIKENHEITFYIKLKNSHSAQWEFVNANGKNQLCSDVLNRQFSKLEIGSIIKYTHDTWSYTATKISNNTIAQTNIKTNKQRRLTKVITLRQHQRINLWESLEFRSIVNQFYKTMPRNQWEILRIDGIDFDQTVYNAVLKQKRSSNSVCKVLTVFHGTKHDNLKKIIQNGFNRDFNQRNKYGKGVYFARDANFSNAYCQTVSINGVTVKKMFVCKIIVGSCCVGNSGMKVPPTKSDGTQYDTLVDTIYNPSIYVICKDYHAIPKYLITFKQKT